MRLLLIEDEAPLRTQLEGQLRKAGYSVDSAEDGRSGLFLGKEHPFDVAVIDLGLPDISGIEVIKQLRDLKHDFPVLILTARDRWQDKVEGLGVGADDYLVKPFHFEELSARLSALIRRNAGQAQSVIQFGPLELDTGKKKLHIDGDEVDVTGYEYRLIEYMMLHPGEVLSKTQLTEHIYDQDFDRDSNVIEVFVGRLRRKLDPDGTLKPIETLRGRGYRFAL